MSKPQISIRMATVDDVATITAQRYRMFVDDGIPDDAHLQKIIDAFRPWILTRLQTGLYSGWLAADGDRVVAGVGMVTLDWPPHPFHEEPLRGYVLNVYTEPEYRGHGIAKQLMRELMKDAVRRKITFVTLHASKMGRPVYERLGFTAASSEMRWTAGRNLPSLQ